VNLRLFHPKEERDHEHDIPKRGKRTDDTGAFARLCVQPEHRINPDQRLAGGRIFRKQHQHHDQGQQPAQIAKGKTRAGYFADIIMVGQGGHQSVGENRGELHADEAKTKGRDSPSQHARLTSGRHPPQATGPRDVEGRKDPDPDHPPPGAVGNCAQDRSKHGNDQRRNCQPEAPIGLCCGLGGFFLHTGAHIVATRHLGKIWAEDEGQQQGVVGLAGPIEEIPAPDALPCRCHFLPYRLIFANQA